MAKNRGRARALIVDTSMAAPRYPQRAARQVVVPRRAGTLMARCARCGECFHVATQLGQHVACARAASLEDAAS